MTDKELTTYLPGLAAARVVTVGDCMTDIWFYGRVERISPEAPVPVFVHEATEVRGGGAANVAANLHALGITGYANTLIGRCRTSDTKRRFVVGRQQIFRSDRETNTPMSKLAEDDAFKAATASPTIGCLILSDYGKGMLTPALCQRLIYWARNRTIPVVVDPKGRDWSKYAGCTVITPNKAEWEDDLKDVPDVAILRTEGANGMTLLDTEGGTTYLPARAREVYDVTGAGDTVVAVLAACLATKVPLLQAARIANAAAGVVVSKAGTATCSLAELEDELCR